MKVNRKFLRSAERLSLSAIAKDSAAQKMSALLRPLAL